MPAEPKLEGNGPIDSRAKVISDSKLGLKFEIRILNYHWNHVHVAETISLMSSNSKQTAEGKQTADIKIKSLIFLLYNFIYCMINALTVNM